MSYNIPKASHIGPNNFRSLGQGLGWNILNRFAYYFQVPERQRR